MPTRQLDVNSHHFRACCCSIKSFCVIVLIIFIAFDVIALIGGGTASALSPLVLNTTSIDEIEDRQRNESTPYDFYIRTSRVAVQSPVLRNSFWLKIVSIVVSALVLVGIGMSNPFLLIPKILWEAFFFGCYLILFVSVVLTMFFCGAVNCGIKPEHLPELWILLLVVAITLIIAGYIFMCVVRCCQLIALENKLQREQEMQMNQVTDSPMRSSKY